MVSLDRPVLNTVRLYPGNGIEENGGEVYKLKNFGMRQFDL